MGAVTQIFTRRSLQEELPFLWQRCQFPSCHIWSSLIVQLFSWYQAVLWKTSMCLMGPSVSAFKSSSCQNVINKMLKLPKRNHLNHLCWGTHVYSLVHFKCVFSILNKREVKTESFTFDSSLLSNLHSWDFCKATNWQAKEPTCDHRSAFQFWMMRQHHRRLNFDQNASYDFILPTWHKTSFFVVFFNSTSSPKLCWFGIVSHSSLFHLIFIIWKELTASNFCVFWSQVVIFAQGSIHEGINTVASQTEYLAHTERWISAQSPMVLRKSFIPMDKDFHQFCRRMRSRICCLIFPSILNFVEDR